MGASTSTHHDVKISDYEKVKIPKEYTLIKVGSYNVNLHNTINMDNKIKEIISYLTSNYKKKSLDVVCIQGFYDNVSLTTLIREFKRYCHKNKIKVYYAPSFDEIETSGSTSNSLIVSSKKMLELSFGTPKGSHGGKKNKKLIQNIIISKYPIVSTIFGELDDKTDMDDIFGIQTVIGANILLGNKIFSVYNLCLSKDIKTANIVNINNAQVRMTELDELMKIIDKNKKDIATLKYTLSDIHLIVGTFSINEFGSGNNNQEYINLIKDRKCIDLFRYLNEKDYGYTTSTSERVNYILLNLTDDIYDKKSELSKNFKSVKSINELFDLIFKRYQVHFLGTYVVKQESALYYPVECVFMIKN